MNVGLALYATEIVEFHACGRARLKSPEMNAGLKHFQFTHKGEQAQDSFTQQRQNANTQQQQQSYLRTFLKTTVLIFDCRTFSTY